MAGLGYFSSVCVDGDGDMGTKPCCITSMADHGTAESLRYFQSRRTVLEMLSDRGYIVPDSELTRSIADFRSQFGEKPDLDRLRITASLRSNPDKKVLVIFCGTAEIRKANIIGILSQIINKDSLYRLILILQSKMNSHARKVVADLSVKVEIFHIADLLVNITKHISTPKHEILTDEEKQKLLKKYSAEDKQIPRMLENDAISKYYGLEKGQMVKITYSGPLTDSHVTFRCVM